MNAFLPNLELVFGWLVAASWQASVLALAVVAIQRIFGARLNPRWRYALWLLVVLRLVLPVLPESALSLFQFAPPPPAALTVSVTEPLFVAAPELPPVHVPETVPHPLHSLSFYSLLAIVWLIGALGLLLLTLIVNHRFARQVANSPEVTDPELLRLFAEAKAEFRVRRPIRLVENSQVQSPAIMGLFHPALLLPVNVRESFDARELRFIFLHELAHLKRGDILIQALIAVLQILHWFNPVLWLAFRRMRIDREPATDALVLSRTGEDEKERYGLMLIKLLEHFNQRHSLATLVGILEDKDQFKRRFSLIARFTSGAYGWSLLGVAILAALALAGLTQAERAAFKRDPALPLVIDLKPFYNRVYADPAGADSKFKGYAGLKTIDGLPFDIGGQIELFGKETADRGTNYPETIEGIKIDRKFDELHLVHAVEWREYYGCPVATIRLHYTDGAVSEFSIRFNQQVNDWSRLYTEDAEVIDDPTTKIIWRGPGGAEGVGRLFKSVLNNPFPEKKVDTMDLISTKSGCSYMLVAATVAQKEPGRAVTPSMPLLSPRNFAGQVKFHIVDKKTGAPIAGAEIYPAMIIGDISLVADNVLTDDNGNAVVKYPTDANGAAKDLRVKVVRAGYQDCEIHWNNGWNAGEIPEEITYRLTREGDTAVDSAIPDFTVTTSAHPTVLGTVRQGDAVGLQQLIDRGTQLPKVDDKGEPLLFTARTAAVVDILLKHGADANAHNLQNQPAINYFCRIGGSQAAPIVEVLLKHGADANSRAGELGETPLMDAEDGKTVDVLFAHGADPSIKRTDGVGVMSGVGMQRTDYLEALLRHGVAFDPKTDGSTILLRASWVSNLPIMKVMLDHGVDPNREGLWAMVHGKPDMMKPLTAAVVDGQFEAAKLLLDHGAKPDDAMDTALTNRQSKVVKLFWDHGVRTISELSYEITQRAPVADLQKLLDSDVPADPPQDAKSSYSPLTLAAQLGELDAVKLLVTRGADVNKGAVPHPKFAVYITSPLVMAASEGQIEIVQFLLDHGATPAPQALWQAAENSTPYNDQKPKEDFEKCVRVLIDAGALKGATPEMQGYILASGLGTRQGPPNAAVVKMLLDAGISPEVPMPYIVENGEKPNSVIGYYRDWYAKKKDDPVYSSMAETMKPLLDLLEAADKGSSKEAGSAQTTVKSTLRELVFGLYDRAKTIPPSKEYLQILQGFYGAEGSWRDVTDVLKKSIQNDSLTVSWQQPYTEIGGDPAYLQVKTLIVSYRLDGVEKVNTFREENPPVGLQASLPVPDSTPAPGASSSASTNAASVPAMPAALTKPFAYQLPQMVAFEATPGTHPDLDKELVDVARDGRTDKVGAGDVDKVRELLGQGASANAKDGQGNSALTWALNFGKDDAAQALIKSGADGRAQDVNGENAAWLAAKLYYCPGALEALIKEGVDVRGVNKPGRTIFESMLTVGAARAGKMNYLRDRVWTEDEYKAYEEREHRTVELLIAAGVDFNGKDGARTPLMGAVQGGHVGMVRALVEHGANKTFKDANGNTALDLAKAFHPELVPLLEPAAGKVDATKPGDAVVSGQLTIPAVAYPDFAKSTGALVSDTGRDYPLGFDAHGQFSVTGVEPGRYRLVVHIVCEPRDMEVGVDKTFGFTEVAPGSHPVVNISWDPTPPAKGGVEIEMKIVQIDEDTYLANKAKIDVDVEKGGAEIIGLLNQMKGVSLLSAPSVTTKPGQKANIDIVHEMPFPTEFEKPKVTPFVGGSPAGGLTNYMLYIPPTPRQFQTKDLGVSAEITPALIGKTLSPQGTVIPDRIMLSGKFSVAEFEGFTQSNMQGISTPTFNTSESHFLEAVTDGERKGVWIPGSHFRSPDAPNAQPGAKADPTAPTIKTRYLLFVSAKEVD